MTITTTGNATSTPMVVGNTAVGTLTINGAPAEVRTDVKVGVTATGNGTLTLSNNASLTITDPGSIDDNRILIGGSGLATLLVQSGSDIVVNGGGYASLDIASQATSVATATFTGTGTTFTANLANNGIMVGYLGNATLNVLAGAVVKTLCFNAAYGANSDGVVNVSGAGSQLIMSNDGGTWATHPGDGGFMRFGSNAGSDGRLNVTSGGLVEIRNSTDQDFPKLQLGNYSGSYGKATVDGNGSKIWVRTLGAGYGAQIEVGREGQGKLEIVNNGDVAVEGIQAEVIIGRDATGNGNVTVSGTGSTLNVIGLEAALFVGQGGTGNLLVSAGGVVTVNQLGGGYDTISIGSDAGSNGTATVTGAGSKLISLGSTADEINVANDGTGSLNIAAGGEVTSQRMFIGHNAGSSGTVSVTGADSKLSLVGLTVYSATERNPGLWIGNRGQGTLTVNSGGSVSVTGDRAFISVGDAYAAAGPGSVGVLNIGANGTVTVDHGLNSTDHWNVVVGTGTLGVGTVNVSGANAKLISLGNQSTVTVGADGQGTLNISAGGESSSQRMFIGANSTGTGTVLVTGAGSKLTINGPAIYNAAFRDPAVWIGADGTGTMTLSSGAVANITGDRAKVFVGDAYGVGALGETGTLNVQSGAVMTIDHGSNSEDHNVLEIGNQQFGNGTVTVTGSGSKIVTLGNNDRIVVGNRGTGVLNVLSGGEINGQRISVGNDNNGVGTLLADGLNTKIVLSAGAVFDPAQDRAVFTVGDNGQGTATIRNNATVNVTGARAELIVGGGWDGDPATGTMTIQSAAKVTIDHGTADPWWNVIVGGGPDGTGTLTVTGAGSELISRGIDNQITVGAEGTGTLNIASGGVVRGWAVNLANDTGSNGTISVSGAGSKLILSNDEHAGGGDGAAYGGNLVMGRNGGTTSALTVSSGGVVEIRNTSTEDNPGLVIGRAAGSTATATVTGLNSAINISQTGASSPDAGSAFILVGRYGDGTLEVNNNAQVNVTGTGTYAGIRISRGNDDNLNLPQVAQSEMRILSGADVTVASSGGNSYGAYFLLAARKNSNALLTMNGAGSTLTINGNNTGTASQETAAFIIGNNGLAVANIANGADVVINGNDDRNPIFAVGQSVGSNGTLSITGAGSTITLQGTNAAANAGSLVTVGRFSGSTGTLNILTGAQVLNNGAATNSVTEVGGSGVYGLNSASTGVVVVDGNGNASTLFDAGQLLVVGAGWSGANATLASVNFTGAGTGSVASLDSAIVRANLIAVGSGGTLSGNSTFDGAVTVDGGGKIAPGASPGILTITGALNLVQGTLDMEVNGLTVGTQYDQLKVNGAVTLANADINLTAGGAFNFADGNRLTLIDGATTLTASNIALIDVNIVGEPATLGWQIADEGGDLVFEALNNGTGAAVVEFGAASTVAATATITDGNGTGTGGRFDAVKFTNATALNGTAAADVFTAAGSTGVTLRGLGGNDRLVSGLADDTLDGGLGSDTADWSVATGAIVFTLDATGGGTTGNVAGIGQDTLIAIENLTGGAAGDTLTGNADNNTLIGGLGADTLTGAAGSDVMRGGAANDTYFDELGDTIVELFNEGSDTVNTTRASYTLGANVERVNFVGSGNFVGTGTSINNRFQGGTGDDRFVDILGGADIFSGGTGNDTVDFRGSVTGAILDFVTNVHGGAAAGDSYSGIEKFLGSNTAGDTMTMGGTGRALFVGGGGDDTLTGGVKNDQLIGQGGNDILSGGADRDSLDGGTGNDTMTGGAAGDVFVFIDAAFGLDTITDYQDGLDSLKVFSAVADNIADFTITGNNSTTVTLTLGANTITINGASPITIAADDFVFY